MTAIPSRAAPNPDPTIYPLTLCVDGACPIWRGERHHLGDLRDAGDAS